MLHPWRASCSHKMDGRPDGRTDRQIEGEREIERLRNRHRREHLNKKKLQLVKLTSTREEVKSAIKCSRINILKVAKHEDNINGELVKYGQVSGEFNVSQKRGAKVTSTSGRE